MTKPHIYARVRVVDPEVRNFDRYVCGSVGTVVEITHDIIHVVWNDDTLPSSRGPMKDRGAQLFMREVEVIDD